VKTAERELARRLRREEGASIKEIARRTGAAQSSISRWVRDIELTEDQREALRIAAYNGHVKGRTMNSKLRREARAIAQEEGRMLASNGDPLFVAGCMLYWAEGEKQASLRHVLHHGLSDQPHPEHLRRHPGDRRFHA
jgi:transcriptional regulator with XRE-family HTH domain